MGAYVISKSWKGGSNAIFSFFKINVNINRIKSATNFDDDDDDDEIAYFTVR